jgi:phospholipid-binding lipoprotein MlaA
MKIPGVPHLATLAAAVLLAGCATTTAHDPRDPFEPFNRTIDSLNHGVDQAAFKPLAQGYEKALPGVARQGVTNFFGNLGDLWSAANTALQGRLGDTAENLMRFPVNTVFGLGGLIDIATDAGIERHKEGFGSTMAHWGVPSGPYVVLPLLGPSTLRDTVALPLDLLGDPLRQVAPPVERNLLVETGAVDLRAQLLPLDAALESALDRYMFMRDGYLQHRNAEVHPGAGTEHDGAGWERDTGGGADVGNDDAAAAAPEPDNGGTSD